jgi:hypothetical protein
VALLLNKFIANPIEKFRQSRLTKVSRFPNAEPVLIKNEEVGQNNNKQLGFQLSKEKPFSQIH